MPAEEKYVIAGMIFLYLALLLFLLGPEILG